MTSFNVENTNLTHFNIQKFYYAPKHLELEVLHVNIENIGALALEFDAELFVGVRAQEYFINFSAHRFSEEEGTRSVQSHNLTLHTSDWLVALRSELHVFTHEVFSHMFSSHGELSRPFSTDPAMTQMFELDPAPIESDAEWGGYKLNDFVRIKLTGEVGHVCAINAKAGKIQVSPAEGSIRMWFAQDELELKNEG